MTDEELREYKKLNHIEDVDVTGQDQIKNVYNNYANWIMVVLMVVVQIGISVLSTLDGEIKDAFPKTELEWIIWIALRVINAVIAFMIFNSFVNEGVKRGKSSANYKNASERFMRLFNKELHKEVKTQSPREYLAKTRGFKAVKLIFSAVLTGVAIGSATIALDWSGLLGTVVSIIMMVVWGYLKMLEVEDYFTNGYLEYVIVLEHKIKNEENENVTRDREDCIS